MKHAVASCSALAVFSCGWHHKPPINEKHLQPSYEAFVGTGLVRAGNLNMEGVQQILELMAESGQLKTPLPAPGKYADPAYQQKAAKGLLK